MITSTAWLTAELRSRAHRSPLRSRPPRRLRGDLGEGVISAAIAVLIMAFLGALMWVGFQKMWTKTEDRTNQQIDHISSDR
jgi:hypothetical protein